jgi:glucose/arabinose dehydrogenase
VIRRAVVALAVTAVLATACSNGDDTTASTGPTTSLKTGTVAPAATTTLASTSPPTTAPPATTTASATTAARATTTTTAPEPTGLEPTVALTSIGTFDSPLHMAWRVGDDATFVVNKSGTIVRFTGRSSTTVLDISDLVSTGAEQGLLGLAFAPAGGRAYINYTDRDGNTTVAEYPVDPDGHFRTGKEVRTVLFVEQPYANHNGGDLVFGPDGLLYIGMGDGGAGGDPDRRATNPADLLGKLLRIDPKSSGARPYTVPADNPFVGTPGARPEIWATGLRNPWRFTFDRRTGDMWIADVGQNAVEEVDVAPAKNGKAAGKGLFFGWSAFEGNDRYNTDVSPDGATPPFVTYTHGPGCSVSGGVRVRGGPVADLVGWYVYGDYCSGDLWALEVLGAGAAMKPGRQVELGNVPKLAEVVEGPAGEAYAVSLDGPILRLDLAG